MTIFTNCWKWLIRQLCQHKRTHTVEWVGFSNSGETFCLDCNAKIAHSSRSYFDDARKTQERYADAERAHQALKEASK